MKLLVTASPGTGHLFPMVPLAWALRSAGHDVLLASAGLGVTLGTAAGLTVVDLAPGRDTPDIMRSAATASGLTPAPTAADDGFRFALDLFTEVSRTTVDAVRGLVGSWRPDAVLHGALEMGGTAAAAEAGVPAVEHAISPAAVPGSMVHAGWSRLSGAPYTAPRAAVGIVPPSMAAPPDPGWAVRAVPYSGGAVLPPELRGTPDRPRVLLTMGTVNPSFGGVDVLRGLVGQVADRGVEVVVALGADPAELGPVPDGVRVLRWVPLSAVLPTCRAVVHHGGAGTSLAALACGVAQVVVPQGADQFVNADALAGAGVALVPGDGGVADALARVLAGDLDDAVARLAAENRALPTPADVAAELPDVLA